MLKKILVPLMVMFYMMAAAGCADKAEQYPVTSEPEKVSIGIQANTITALVLTAKGQGYFAEEHVDVTIKKYPSGKLALKGMFNHEVHLATAADMPIMINSFSRNDFLVLATIAYTDNGAWIIARKDRGISKHEDLKGKKIATQKSSAVHFFLSVFLLHHHILESEVEIVFMKAVDLPQALINEDIDAFSMRNPFIRQAKEKLGDNAVELFEPNAYHMTFNLVAGRNFITHHPGTIKKIIKALVKSQQFIIKNKEKAMQITANQLGGRKKPEVLSDWDSFVFGLSLNQSLILGLEDQARWAIKNHLVSGTEVPNYLDYIYIDALETLCPEAVEIIH